MNPLFAEIRTSVLLTAVFAVLLCGVYPLVVWAGGQALFPRQANGSLIFDTEGKVRGSALLAQSFHGDRYFQPRPSAAGSGYDAAASSGTNLGPTSRKLAQSLETAVAAYRAANALGTEVAIPADAVTSSASGLDPHISLANANFQAPRVARARGLPLSRVQALMKTCTRDRDFGLLGERVVNVLLLNLALDQSARSSAIDPD